ncbi:MAG: ABC transporter ATP-binding protein [Candidatus Aminicenantes bacterium]|nr:ABC transporter ATP-binding protein [Candidatus Aminicenantes bacterium]
MQTGNSHIALNLKKLTKSYGNLIAVKDLSLDVFQGEIFGLLGPNGAGKTTTIHMICGLLKCDSGEVYINGKSLKQNYRECKSFLGLCPQNLVIWESLSCLEQLEFMGRQYDVNYRNARERSLQLLEILGLYQKRNKLAKTLSGGMKRRLNFALGLVHDPDILILDEPQAGLDPQSRLLVRDYIRSLAKKKTVILTTHEMHEAEQLSDRIAIIDHGQLLVLDTPERLKNQIGQGDILEIKIDEEQEEKITRFMNGLPGRLHRLFFQDGALRLVDVEIKEMLPLILRNLKKAQIEAQDIMIRKKTLEDVFISLTGRRLRE